MPKRAADGPISKELGPKIMRLSDKKARSRDEIDLTSGDSSEDEITYVDLGPSGKPDPEAKRQSELLARLKSLPPDVRDEYLGQNFDFEKDSLQPYEQRRGVDFFSRISCREDDIPNIVVQIHPDLFIDSNKFKGFVNCLHEEGKLSDAPADLWKRNMLMEAPPYRSDNAMRAPCKRQKALLDAELPKHKLIDSTANRLVRSTYTDDKLVDSRTFIALKQMLKSLDTESFKRQHLLTPGPISEHFSYVKSADNIDRMEFGRLQVYNGTKDNNAFPEIIARKGNHTFISGRLMQQARELLKVNLFELHEQKQIQLMNHFRSGDPAGDYQSLFTHARGNFVFPSKTQTEQLGLPRDFQYKKETDFKTQNLHRNSSLEEREDGSESDTELAQDKRSRDFLKSLKERDEIDYARDAYRDYFRQAMENNPLHRHVPKVDFAALLASDYHQVRLAISLIEDDRPFDIERCNKIREHLKLDEHLRHREVPAERPRERDTGR